MWAIQFKHDGMWQTCVNDLSKSTLQVFMFEEEAKKELASYRGHVFEHRLIEVDIVATAKKDLATVMPCDCARCVGKVGG